MYTRLKFIFITNKIDKNKNNTFLSISQNILRDEWPIEGNNLLNYLYLLFYQNL